MREFLTEEQLRQLRLLQQYAPGDMQTRIIRPSESFLHSPPEAGLTDYVPQGPVQSPELMDYSNKRRLEQFSRQLDPRLSTDLDVRQRTAQMHRLISQLLGFGN